MKNKPKSKKPMVIGGSITGTIILMLIIFTSPEYHCLNVSEETKNDYIQYLYDGLPDFQKSMVDSGRARIMDSPDVPIQYIQDRAYEFCISQKPDVPATVVLQFESVNATHTILGNTIDNKVIEHEGD